MNDNIVTMVKMTIKNDDNRHNRQDTINITTSNTGTDSDVDDDDPGDEKFGAYT